MADNIVRKVENLLRLSESSNIHEATLAAKKAKAIADKYNICLEILREKKHEKKENIIDYTKTYKEVFKRRLSVWELRLAQMLSSHYHCRVFLNQENNLNIVGYSSDIFLFDSMFSWLQTQLKMLILEEKIDREWEDIFLFGAIQFIDEELTNSRKTTEEQMKTKFTEASVAISKINNKLKEIDEFLKLENLKENKFELKKEQEIFNKGWFSANKLLINKKILN